MSSRAPGTVDHADASVTPELVIKRSRRKRLVARSFLIGQGIGSRKPLLAENTSITANVIHGILGRKDFWTRMTTWMILIGRPIGWSFRETASRRFIDGHYTKIMNWYVCSFF